ncbi:MAG TPA: hypothetical protein DD379_21315 [Cyanobacteria bacterium UBA11162]|nr:hypothetical protein [Cyanobacteria bacterium UBA11162]
MKLSFDRMNFFSSLLQNTIVGVIIITNPVAVSALIPQDMTLATPPRVVSIVNDNLGTRTGKLEGLYINYYTTILASEPEDPPAPRDKKPGVGF